MQTGPDWSEEHVLTDGTPVTLRHIRPSDAGELRRAFHSLSPESRYRRFFRDVSDLSPNALRYLTEVDGMNHVAIVAVGYAPDLKTEIGYGIARFVRVAAEPDVAEAAITVIDPMQRRGLGRILALSLAHAARERGIRRFRGEVLVANAPMRGLVEGLGAEVHSESSDALTIDIALDDAHAAGEPAVLRWLRAAADRLAGTFRTMPPPG